MKKNIFLLLAVVFLSCSNKYVEIDKVCNLGEGAIWDYLHQRYIFVDILNDEINYYYPKSKKLVSYTVESLPGTVVPTKDSETVILALKDGIKEFSPPDRFKIISHPEGNVNNRYNDGKCDYWGNLWVGSMSLNNKKNEGSLFRVSSNKTDTILTNISISNGLVWSLDSSELYYIDTPSQMVKVFNINNENGNILGLKDSLQINDSLGSPDGSTIDNQGFLWIAMWGGHSVTRWNMNKMELDTIINLPALNVTSLSFGGENLDQMFITTAKVGTTEEQLKEFPESGKVLSLLTKYKGIRCNYFHNK